VKLSDVFNLGVLFQEQVVDMGLVILVSGVVIFLMSGFPARSGDPRHGELFAILRPEQRNPGFEIGSHDQAFDLCILFLRQMQFHENSFRYLTAIATQEAKVDLAGDHTLPSRP
jgi:hypothetical protein